MASRSITLSTAGCVVAIAAAVLPAGGEAAGTPRCGASDLAGAIIDVQGAAGSRFGRLILINRTQRSCHTNGFIGGQLIDTDGRPLATKIVRDHRTRAQTVVIRSGAAGALTVHWNVIPSGNRPCQTAQWLRVTPPNDTRSLRVFFGDTACRGQIDVGPVTNPQTV